MTRKRSLLARLHCLVRGHNWVRPPFHAHLISLNSTLDEIRTIPLCKGDCTRCKKSDCCWNRR